ncbi:MAG TPA: serine hydrolase [Firmicutes bacterium]|nr:serine hydrolase [Bacillota bacterium]
MEREIGKWLAALPGRVSLTVEAVWPSSGEGEWLFVREADRPHVAASLIKLPILLAVLAAAERGELSLDREVEVGGERTGGAGVIEHFRPGTVLTLADLLFCMIAVSDNAATNHVLDLIGFEPVNAFCGEFGLTDTVLRRRMMDAAARAEGRENLTTAADLHRLLREILRPRRLSPSVAAQARALLAAQQVKLGWALFLPEERLAHKTGDLEGVFHDAGLLDPAGPVPLVYTFLSSGVPDSGEAAVVAGRVGQVAAGWAASLRPPSAEKGR